MTSLLTVSRAQGRLREQLRAKRLQQGLTQAGLARRAGVSLSTLRQFEQKGQISLESFLKLLMVLGGLEGLMESLKPEAEAFQSIDDVLKTDGKKQRQYGWRT